ncbi:Fic family protein [Rahnella woolbedingensis]|uniref:Fic family protein n=1 Tax=Rahnella woolbedingensis TaxID=1510574 RepID=A0A419N7N8_9GAMM|nr:Fic family protein [Rahnella woolbedingensis]RJT43435.1 Fic family protein [Rahnella woolbedingensis]
MSIKFPPALIPLETLTGQQWMQYQPCARLVDDQGRYLPWDEYQYRVAKGLDAAVAWSFTRRARHSAMQFINYGNIQKQQAGFNHTALMAEVCEQIDKFSTAQALIQQRERLSGMGAALSQFQFEEPITSSQLEGANTTTLVARSLLASGRKPRTESEQMIVGNARMMKEINSHLDEPLSPGLIRQFHATGMEGIDDAKYVPGNFRTTDDVVIADYDGNIVHQPPPAEQITERLQRMCDWANATQGNYIHPLIRACILHFMIAHEHPFRDGNGRTSRALFYWSLLKSGYDAFRYISISSLLYASPVKYAQSYQRTESDNMDLTFFLEYQMGIVKRALNQYLQHIETLISRRVATDRMLYESGAFFRLTHRQIILVNVMLCWPDTELSAAQVSEIMGLADNTARNDLRALVRETLAEEHKINGQKTIYTLSKNLS